MTAARLDFTWLGQDKFLQLRKDDSAKPEWVARDHPAASEVRPAGFFGVVGDTNATDGVHETWAYPARLGVRELHAGSWDGVKSGAQVYGSELQVE